ncbi:hypothetical protein PLESTB_001358500 [Pleodorina starrii]|uniref:PPIase cyclophilin-type domain-containing protein n=1 Tax=Pleodorina starrii TaxID=330485 RepID=A0A9W6BUY7_9CHLO|nr:hypothetical protein PLESTM_001918300 [Pleodorina starrii]GLC58435.1 hypothetical protein PLESTB_001358500 [Pleodorina starrii]GLC76490.1 hypothetical protein PLESTF_001786900 [Pleodorina starrii]
MLSFHTRPVSVRPRSYNGRSKKSALLRASSSKGSEVDARLPVPAFAPSGTERLSCLQEARPSSPANQIAGNAAPATRRAALVALPAAAALAAALLTAPRPASAATALSALDSQPSTSGREDVDTTITHRVALTIGIANRALKKAEERTIGDKSIIPEAEPIGRVVIGLYGNAVPRTVSNFLALVESGNLVGTTFSRVLAGEYIEAGKQGTKRLGAVEVPATVQPNPEVSEASAFRLSHYRPGTVSLALGENDEEPTLRQRPEYKPVEFLITTGPGPVPRLNGANIVFGRVLEGMSVVGQVAQVPVFGPSPVGNSLAFNSLASAIGDDRAATVRRKYGKPLKAVVILGSEVLPEEGEAADAAGP